MTTNETMTGHQRERAARFCAGYTRGLNDGWDGTQADVSAADSQYASGYRSGLAWGIKHPAPYRTTASAS